MKSKITINLDPQILATAEKYAEISGVSRAEYLAGIVEWWYGQNSPPISNADARLRNERSSPRSLGQSPTTSRLTKRV